MLRQSCFLRQIGARFCDTVRRIFLAIQSFTDTVPDIVGGELNIKHRGDNRFGTGSLKLRVASIRLSGRLVMHLHQLSIRFVLYILSCIVIDVLANEDNGYILSLEHAFGEGRLLLQIVIDLRFFLRF